MVDPSLAHLSDQLFWIALVTYSVAMLGFFAHLAYGGRRVGTAGMLLASAGAVAHASSIATRGLAAGRVPWGNMYEYSSLVGFLLVATFLIVIAGRERLRQVGGFVLGLAVLLLAAARLLYAPAGPLVPALNTYWIKIHVVAAISASSIYSLSFIFTILYLVKDRAERRAVRFTGSTVGAAYVGTSTEEQSGFPDDYLTVEPEDPKPEPQAGVLGRLPTAGTFDRLAYRTVAFAFPIWTFAVIAGALWANKAWGRYWGWDPKETWSFITWVVYAGYLHARATAKWRGRRAAAVNIVGFVVLMITYYAVNLWIVGLHSYAGVSS